jgi:ADP-heptose:LPS heptosyltransferase
MGNSLMAMPMVRQIKRAWPQCRITILARNRAMGEPLRVLPEVDEVLISGLGIKALLRNIGWMWRRKPGVYLVPFPSNRWHYSLLALTSFAKRKVLHSYPVGYWRALHFIGERTPAERGIHDVIQNLRMLRMLGIEVDESERPVFPISESDRAAAQNLLGGIENFIAVHAGGGSYLAWSALGQEERAALLKAKQDLEESIARVAAELRAALAARLSFPPEGGG